MSASILRNLVSSVFNINPRFVKLSGEIKPDHAFADTYRTDYSNDYNKDEVWGFNPQTGFIKLINKGEGGVLEFVPNVANNYIFFVVHNEGERWQNTWDMIDSWDTWTIYKAPNFAAYFAAIEQSDLIRWANWLNEEAFHE